MYEKYTTIGFVINSRNFSEADKLLSVFTEDFGLIKVLVKSVRNIKSKYKAYIEVGFKIKITVIKGRGIWRATDIECDFFEQLSLKSLKYFIKPILFIKNLVHGEDKSEVLFGSIEESFCFLRENILSDEDLGLFEIVFSIRIMNALGYIGSIDSRLNLSGKLTESDIDFSRSNKRSLIGIINSSLKETHLIQNKTMS